MVLCQSQIAWRLHFTLLKSPDFTKCLAKHQNCSKLPPVRQNSNNQEKNKMSGSMKQISSTTILFNRINNTTTSIPPQTRFNGVLKTLRKENCRNKIFQFRCQIRQTKEFLPILFTSDFLLVKHKTCCVNATKVVPHTDS